MQLDDIARLRLQADDINSARQGLQVGVGAGHFAEGIGHREGVFVTIEVEGLETRAAAGFEVVYTSVLGRGDGGQEIGGKDPRSVDRLEAVAESSAHKANFFLTHDHILVVMKLFLSHQH